MNYILNWFESKTSWNLVPWYYAK